MNIESWARRLIQEAVSEWGQPLARYGTPAWSRMPPKQRWAAVVIAAECWRREGEVDDITRRLTLELEEGRLSAKRAEDQAYRERAAAHREQWRWLRGRGAPSEWRDDVDEPDTTPRGPITVEELTWT